MRQAVPLQVEQNDKINTFNINPLIITILYYIVCYSLFHPKGSDYIYYLLIYIKALKFCAIIAIIGVKHYFSPLEESKEHF